MDSVIDWLALKLHRAGKENGFVGCVIYGLQGSGKTTFAMRTLFRYFREVGYDEEGSWEWTLKNTFFSVAEVLDALDPESIVAMLREAIIWDDAGVHASAYLSKLDPGTTRMIAAAIQLARTQTCGILFTTPHPTGILRCVRDMPDWYRVHIRYVGQKDGVKYSVANIYKVKVSPLGETYAKKVVAEAPFKVRLPDEVYQTYMKRRAEFIQKLLQQFRQDLNRKPQSAESPRLALVK